MNSSIGQPDPPVMPHFVYYQLKADNQIINEGIMNNLKDDIAPVF
jgi:hypothetical protein